MHKVVPRSDPVGALPPGTGFVQLTIEVQKPTLAFFLGTKWSLISDPRNNTRAISQAWQTSTLYYSTANTYAATAMSDTDTLLRLVQCKQSDMLPAAVAQHTITASVWSF